MKKEAILIVDDEKNIRITLAQALDTMDLDIQAAINGEEALQLLAENEFDAILLDIKMPGMNGLEVLKRIQKDYPYTKVIMISAHGTIDCAVEAMKSGAVDFIKKPFSLDEIRTLVKKVLSRDSLKEDELSDYEALLELTKKYLNRRNIPAAIETVRRAIARETDKPEAYNLLGTILESKGDKLESQKFYRAALEIDPTYKPARANLSRLTFRREDTDIDFGK